MVIQNRRGLVCSSMCWLFIGRPRLCFAVNQILAFLNYHENFRTYFLRGTILLATLFYSPHFTMFSLLYDLSLERKKGFIAA